MMTIAFAPTGRAGPVAALVDWMEPRRIRREVRHRAIVPLVMHHVTQIFHQEAFAVASQQAVPAKTCASPVQPRRSSRCGQSVGISIKFERCDQMVFSTSRLTAATPVVMPPVATGTELIGTISMERRFTSPSSVTRA